MPKTLRDNVNVDGRWYTRGMTREQVGDVVFGGDHVWVGNDEGGEGADTDAGALPQSAQAPAAEPHPESVGAGSESGEVAGSAPAPSADAPKPPPRHGRGSSEEAWRDYAELVGVDVSRAEGRDDVIALIEAAQKRG